MSERQKQVISNLKELVSGFINRESNRTSLITVTNISLSADLKRATVFVTVLPQEKEEDVIHFLKRRGKDLRSYVKERAKMKFIPFFEFSIDEGEKNRQRIDSLLSD